jgi:hypothetical protein
VEPISGTVQGGQIRLDSEVTWPDGTKVDVIPHQNPAAEAFGISETEWRDDAASLADWKAWLQTIEPLEFTREEEAERARFRDEMRRFNIEAVRRQMENDLP